VTWQRISVTTGTSGSPSPWYLIFDDARPTAEQYRADTASTADDLVSKLNQVDYPS
jgi:phenylacetate-coenzyme A ligase PaaK-like adenylate-forming protein